MGCFHSLQNMHSRAGRIRACKIGQKPSYFSVILLSEHRVVLLCSVYRMIVQVVSLNRQPLMCSSVSPVELSKAQCYGRKEMTLIQFIKIHGWSFK